MTAERLPEEPRRIVQKFSKEKLAEFRNMPAAAKLAWLEEINLLYRLARDQRGRASH